MKIPDGFLTIVADGKIVFYIIKLFINLKNKIMFPKLLYYFHLILFKIESGLNKAISQYAVPSIDFLNEVKKIIDNPVVDFALLDIAKLPGAAEAKTFLDAAIPKAVEALGIMHTDITVVAGSTTPTTQDYVKALVQFLQSQSPELQQSALAKVASLLVRAGDGAISASRADSIVQLTYTTIKEKAIAVAATAPAA